MHHSDMHRTLPYLIPQRLKQAIYTVLPISYYPLEAYQPRRARKYRPNIKHRAYLGCYFRYATCAVNMTNGIHEDDKGNLISYFLS